MKGLQCARSSGEEISTPSGWKVAEGVPLLDRVGPERLGRAAEHPVDVARVENERQPPGTSRTWTGPAP